MDEIKRAMLGDQEAAKRLTDAGVLVTGMTRKEAARVLECGAWWDCLPDDMSDADMNPLQDALDVALEALRPITREKVEKVFPGCDFCKIEMGDYPYIVAHGDYSSSDTCYEPRFCPICGKTLTDEAVDMVVERLEALKDGSTTD